MDQYTIILEFEGGTFIHQVKAENSQEALKNWCLFVESEKLFGRRTNRLLQSIEKSSKRSGMDAVDGLTGVWCFTSLFAKRLVLGHVIRSA